MYSSRAAVLMSFLISIGCASTSTDEMDGHVAETDQAVVTANRLTMNRLTMNRLTMNSLSASKLSLNGTQLSATKLASTEDGREVLRYLIRCALPEGTSLTTTVSGTTYEFPGLIGLAPEWITGPLSGTGRRWISACLLAHVNGYGVQVPISIRGNHPALTADNDERSYYGVQEVSFFGDLFANNNDDDDDDDDDDGGEPAIPVYACGGSTIQTACGSSGASFRPARSCASGDDCAIQFLGACHDISSTHADVCGSVLSDGYSKCHTTVKSSFGLWPNGKIYNEVITVYMAPTDFNTFYTGCALLATE